VSGPGRFPVAVRHIDARDESRARTFPCEIWTPEGAPGALPLAVYSHHSFGSRMAATFLCTHLASHGYAVAALDHSETIVPELERKPGESAAKSEARMQALVAARVPDLQFLLDTVLAMPGVAIDSTRIAAVGHSFGGWTVLAAPEVDPRIRAVVAMAPAGSANPRPGIIRAPLTFDWRRDVPTLFVAAENDVSIPLEHIRELYDRAPAPKRLVVLPRADHMHFLDNVEEQHEAVRAMTFPPQLAWMQAEMRPIAQLISGEEAHTLLRDVILAHLNGAGLQGES